MHRKNFKNQYSFLKELFEKIDPAGIGAKNEYDDLIFRIMKKNKNIIDQNIFAQNMVDVIVKQYDMQKGNILKSCKEISSLFFDRFPKGF